MQQCQVDYSRSKSTMHSMQILLKLWVVGKEKAKIYKISLMSSHFSSKTRFSLKKKNFRSI